MKIQSINNFSLQSTKSNKVNSSPNFGANLVFTKNTGKEFISALKTSNPKLLEKLGLNSWDELLPFVRGAFYSQTRIVPGTVKISQSDVVGKLNISHSFPAENLNSRRYNHSSGDATAKYLQASLGVSTDAFIDDVMHVVEFQA